MRVHVYTSCAGEGVSNCRWSVLTSALKEVMSERYVLQTIGW